MLVEFHQAAELLRATIFNIVHFNPDSSGIQSPFERRHDIIEGIMDNCAADDQLKSLFFA